MKWAVVTGASSNLGKAISLHLASKGFDLLLHFHKSSESIEKIKQSINVLGRECHFFRADFSKRDGVTSFFEFCVAHTDKVDLLVNNAGVFQYEGLSEIDEEQFLEILQINSLAPYMLMKKLFSFLEGGAVVNIGNAGLLNGKIFDASAYFLTKEMLLQVSKTLAKEYLDKIQINSISPGYLEKSIECKNDPMFHTHRVSYDKILATIDFLLQNIEITGQNIEVAKGVSL